MDQQSGQNPTAPTSPAPVPQAPAQPTAPQSPPAATPSVNPHGGGGKKKWLIIGGLLLILIALPVALILSQQNQDTREHAAEPKVKNQFNKPAKDQANGNQDASVAQNGNDIDAISSILDDESKDEAAADNSEDAQNNDLSNSIQDIQTLANTDPDNE